MDHLSATNDPAMEKNGSDAHTIPWHETDILHEMAFTANGFRPSLHFVDQIILIRSKLNVRPLF